MRFTYPLQAFLAGKKSLVELEHDFSGVSGEELFIAVASLTALERQRLRDAIFTASLLTALAVHYECPLVEFGQIVQRQINRVEYLRS